MPRRKRFSAASMLAEKENAQNIVKRRSKSPPPSAEIQLPIKKNNDIHTSASDDVTHAEDCPAKPAREHTISSPPKELPDVKARKCVKRSLTQEEEEDDLVEWLQEKSFLYNKASAEFKLRDKKARTWLDKEHELGLNAGDLSLIWYPNMRTQFSKLIKVDNMSGNGLQERTARQNWLLQKFGFIRPYLVQLCQQRGSKFAEKEKELTLPDTPVDAVVENETNSGVRPKSSSTLVTSLNEELSSLKDCMSVNDKAGSTGQFLVHMMRDMTEANRQEFILSATRLAIEAVQKGNTCLAMQNIPDTQQQERTIVVSNTRPRSSAAGPASQLQQIVYEQQQQQMQNDYQLATNIAASAPPASRTPAIRHYHRLQPPNVQPLLHVPKSPYTSSMSPSVQPTSCIIRQAMNIASIPTTSFSRPKC